MRLALAQINSTPGDLAGNFAHVTEFANQAFAQGADLVVFPEKALGDFYQFYTSFSEYEQTFTQLMSELVGKIEGTILVRTKLFEDLLAYCDKDELPHITETMERLRSNKARELHPFEKFAPQDFEWSCLPYDVAAEVRATVPTGYMLVSPGKIQPLFATLEGEPLKFEFGGVRFGIDDNCYYLSAVELAELDVFIQPREVHYLYRPDNATTYFEDTIAEYTEFAPDPEMRPALALLSSVGGFDDVIDLGMSGIINNSGEVVAQAPAFEESLLMVDIEPHDEAELGAPRISRVRAADAAGVASAYAPVRELTRFELLFKGLSLALQDYVNKNHQQGVLIGLSGGMDSALVATLAVHALGPRRVIGVLMPGPYTSLESKEDATELAENLGIETRTQQIAPLSTMFIRTFGHEHKRAIEENVQARMRGTMLMTFSNALHYLVLNTSNKSEAAMGYSTLYGDTVGGFAPLSNVYKSDIYPLARAAQTFFGGKNPIPERVFVKPPSAELAADQTDEESLGASYKIIDAVLDTYLTHPADANTVLWRLLSDTTLSDEEREALDEKTVATILNRLHTFQFKRMQEPFGPVVSQPELDCEDWPVTCAYRLGQELC